MLVLHWLLSMFGAVAVAPCCSCFRYCCCCYCCYGLLFPLLLHLAVATFYGRHRANHPSFTSTRYKSAVRHVKPAIAASQQQQQQQQQRQRRHYQCHRSYQLRYSPSPRPNKGLPLAPTYQSHLISCLSSTCVYLPLFSIIHLCLSLPLSLCPIWCFCFYLCCSLISVLVYLSLISPFSTYSCRNPCPCKNTCPYVKKPHLYEGPGAKYARTLYSTCARTTYYRACARTRTCARTTLHM